MKAFTLNFGGRTQLIYAATGGDDGSREICDLKRNSSIISIQYCSLVNGRLVFYVPFLFYLQRRDRRRMLLISVDEGQR